MKVQSSIMQDKIWKRGYNEDVIRVTLRDNFVEEKTEEAEMITFDEVDVFIKKRDNMDDFILSNFNKLFLLGIEQEAMEVIKC